MLVKSQDGLKPFAYLQPGLILGSPIPPLSCLEPVPLGKGAREVSIPCLLALRFAANRRILGALCGGDRDSVFH